MEVVDCVTAREDREIVTVSVVVKEYQRHEPTSKQSVTTGRSDPKKQ